MVVEGDLCPECRGFESQHCLLDGHFYTYICCKNCNVCLKRPKINKKEAGVGPFLKNFVELHLESACESVFQNYFDQLCLV